MPDCSHYALGVSGQTATIWLSYPPLWSCPRAEEKGTPCFSVEEPGGKQQK